jgi:redox-sensitive bicupin YhaK (pirin superfamily)
MEYLMPDNAVYSQVLHPDKRDLGEFTVSRLLPSKRRPRVGPFVFFDYIGPADFPPGKGVNVRSHPHIGLATITYLFEGEILHRDNLGYVQTIRPGAVNWMTAGKGIVHSEKVTDEVLASGQRLHGIQTWVALPLEYEETDPRFEHYPADAIPAVESDGASLRVVIGSAYGATSPVTSESEIVYVEARLAAGTELELPETDELAVFVVEGDCTVGGETAPPGTLAVLADGTSAKLRAATDTHLMLCGGGTLEGPRIVWWNLVNSSRERIEQAKRDWREGRFPPVPGETDFIPLPDS